MKITFKGDYALKTVLDLALNHNRNLSKIPDMARRLDIPRKFLEQILLELKKGGFVNSKRGKEGGFYLAKDPSSIKLGDVIRFIDGPIEPIGCVRASYKGCRDIHHCVFKKIWCKTTKALLDIVDRITFEDLVQDVTAGKAALSYSI
ncbi:MAG: Rrf2 family transcriptional regulator [Candidatus Aureabacteria bacterium]|nr:Rrf2 family transcriptional regulator [Candidatus Auribacterota bacterium]